MNSGSIACPNPFFNGKALQEPTKILTNYLGYLLILVLILGHGACHAQHYGLQKNDWVIGSAGIVLNAVAIHLKNQVEPLSVEQLDGLVSSNLNKFDKGAINQFKTSDANTSDFLLAASMAAPLTLMIDKKIRSNYLPVAVMFAEVTLLTGGITNLTKSLAKRNRPFVFNENVPIEMKTTREARLSFFSGHVSNTAAFSFLTAHVASSYFNDPTIKTVVWISAATLPIATGYLRYSSGKHYPTDLIAGYLVGAAIGYLVPHWHKVNNSDLSLQLGLSSISITYQIR